MEPSRRRSRMAEACSFTSSYDERSKAQAMDSWSTGRNSGLMSCSNLTISSAADTSRPPFDDATLGQVFLGGARHAVNTSGAMTGWHDLRSEEHTSELQSLRHLVCR